MKSEHSSHDWHVQPDCQRSKSLIHTRWGALDSVLRPKLPDFLETYGSHTSGSATRAATWLLLWIAALWRPALEATFTNLSIPELPVNCSAQLFLPASTSSIYVDCGCGSQGVQLVNGLLRRAILVAQAFQPVRITHDKTASASVRYSRWRRIETATPKRNIKLKRSLSLAGGTRSESLCFPSVVRWPSSEGDFRITQPRGQGRLAFYIRCL